MIQRIQSIFLFIVFGISVVDCFMPLATCGQFRMTTLNVTDLQKGEVFSNIQPYPLFILMIGIALLTIVIIFLYKNRFTQIKLCRMNMLLNIIFVILLFFYADAIEQKVSASLQYTIYSVLPLISLVLLFLANRAIKKDNELIKSTDRLR